MLTFADLAQLAVSDQEVSQLVDFSKGQLSERISEDFAGMKDYEQNNPHHCYDLLTHSIKTALGIRNDDLPRSSFSELRIAALFHDIGKPLVAKQVREKTVYYNHAEASERIARQYLTQIGGAARTVDRICFYILRHDMFIGVSLEEDEKDGADAQAEIRKILDRTTEKYNSPECGFVPRAEDYQLLMKLCRADIYAQSDEVFENGVLVSTKQQKLVAINIADSVLRQLAKVEECANKSFIFFPFKVDSSLSEISKALDASGRWRGFCSTLTKGTQKRDNDNTRYLLNHVGASIHANAADNDICVQRQLDKEKTVFRNNNVSFSFDTVFFGWNHLKRVSVGEFQLRGVYFYCFDTGVCLLVLEIEHLRSCIEDIADSLFLLKQCDKQVINVDRGLSGDRQNSSSDRRLSLRDIAETILSDVLRNEYRLIDNWSVSDYQRSYVMTYVETLAPATDRQLFLLSHGYNTDFRYVADTDDKPRIYRNNDTCIWGLTTEASVCIARLTSENRSFITSAFSNNISNGYLLLFVLLLHQKYVLQEFLSKNDLRNNQENCRSSVLARRYRDEFYLFEQKYNFRYVSDVAQYQNLYEIVYDSFKIDALFADVKEPLEAIKEELEEQEQEKEAKSDKKTEKALTILSLFAVFSALVDAWQSVSSLKEAISSFESVTAHIIHLIVSVVIIAVFLILGGPLLFNTFRDLRSNKRENDASGKPKEGEKKK